MGQLDFPSPYWDNVSDSAKVCDLVYASLCRCVHVHGVSRSTFWLLSLQELITCMLQVEVDQRYTALQVLEHPWVNVSDPRHNPGKGNK